jgi:signal transduction histidine kinase
MRLRNKILSLALPLTLVPFVLTALTVYYFVIRGQRIRADEELSKLLSEAITNLRKEQNAARSDVELIASFPAVVDYLESAGTVGHTAQQFQPKEAEARTVLRLFADRSAYYFQLGIVDAQGQERIKFTKLPGGQGLESIKGEDYFRRTLIMGAFQSPITRMGPDRFASILTNRVGRGNFSGAVVLHLNADVFQRSMRPLLASHGLNTFLFDDRGLVFARSFAGAEEEGCLSGVDLGREAAALLAMPSLELSSREILSGARAFIFTVLPAESYGRSRYEPQPGENWFLGVLRPKPAALRETVTFQVIFSAILVAAVGAVFWATTRFARRIAVPLERVSDATANIARGDFDINLSVRTGDEVEALAAAVARMADELKNYRAELVRSAKLATIGEMASEISHEIQNRISGVSLWAQYLDAELTADDPRREYLEEMKQGLKGFTSLLQDLKQFYKTPILHIDEVNLNELIRTAVVSVEHHVRGRNVETALCLDRNLQAVRCDAEKIKSVILNLVLNAIEAVEPGGHIEIATRRPASGADGSGVIISVSDTGCGISEQDLPRIFYPFYSTKGGGSGLGLAIASNLVSAHGGKLEVSSSQGEGATFTVTLPQTKIISNESEYGEDTATRR